MTVPSRDLAALVEACASGLFDDESADAEIDLREGVALVPPPAWARNVVLRSLEHLRKVGGSDLHVKAGGPPRVRVDGQLRPAPLPALNVEDCEAVALAVLPSRLVVPFGQGREVDAALDLEGLGRFRVHAFRERGRAALAIRAIASGVPDADQLGLAAAVQGLADESAGLVLVAGGAGSGKSTTLAWMVERVNRTRSANIVTIEDPIEVVHADVRSIVHQREVGDDTDSYAAGLRAALRQDPDVVAIGEIRDGDTADVALGAAQSGHLVVATVHADTAVEAIDRLIGLVPAGRQDQARLSLAGCLRGIVAQRLVPTGAGRGRRVLVQELLVGTPRTAERIAHPDGAGPGLIEIMADDQYLGMTTFDQDLARLTRLGLLGRSEALAAATDRRDLAVDLDAGV